MDEKTMLEETNKFLKTLELSSSYIKKMFQNIITEFKANKIEIEDKMQPADNSSVVLLTKKDFLKFNRSLENFLKDILILQFKLHEFNVNDQIDLKHLRKKINEIGFINSKQLDLASSNAAVLYTVEKNLIMIFKIFEDIFRTNDKVKISYVLQNDRILFRKLLLFKNELNKTSHDFWIMSNFYKMNQFLHKDLVAAFKDVLAKLQHDVWAYERGDKSLKIDQPWSYVEFMTFLVHWKDSNGEPMSQYIKKGYKKNPNLRAQDFDLENMWVHQSSVLINHLFYEIDRDYNDTMPQFLGEKISSIIDFRKIRTGCVDVVKAEQLMQKYIERFTEKPKYLLQLLAYAAPFIKVVLLDETATTQFHTITLGNMPGRTSAGTIDVVKIALKALDIAQNPKKISALVKQILATGILSDFHVDYPFIASIGLDNIINNSPFFLPSEEITKKIIEKIEKNLFKHFAKQENQKFFQEFEKIEKILKKIKHDLGPGQFISFNVENLIENLNKVETTNTPLTQVAFTIRPEVSFKLSPELISKLYDFIFNAASQKMQKSEPKSVSKLPCNCEKSKIYEVVWAIKKTLNLFTMPLKMTHNLFFTFCKYLAQYWKATVQQTNPKLKDKTTITPKETYENTSNGDCSSWRAAANQIKSPSAASSKINHSLVT